MGRRGIGPRSQKVSPFICCLTYVFAVATVAAFFLIKPFETAYSNGFAAHIVSTVVIFAFSCTFGNTSLYDPAWYVLPVAVAAGWLVSGGFSVRGVAAFAGLVFWSSRFLLQLRWEGFYTGVEGEDWRYNAFSSRISNGALYWAVSFFALHLCPTLFVFGGLQPVESIWTAGEKQIEFGPLDVVALAVTFSSTVIAYIADKQLDDFRYRDYGKDAFLNHASGGRKACREGLWAYSRHPNYFGEIFFWFGMSLIRVAGDSNPETSRWYEVYGGIIVMYGLFHFFSAPVMDKRNLQNRDNYEEIMKEIWMLIPGPVFSSKNKSQ